MNRKPKTRFINLAEQMTLQNDIVNSTMDSMLKFVADGESVKERSDYEEIKKTAEQVGELNPQIETSETIEKTVRKPKLALKRSLNSQSVKQD